MWRKKLNNNQRGPPQSTALLQGTPYGATVFAGGGGTDSYQTRPPPERRKPAPKPSHEEVKRKGLPPVSSNPASKTVPGQPESKFRPVSSIYSQPSSPNAGATQFPQNSYQYSTATYQEAEISPPSSPEIGRSQAQHLDDEVSPIDATPDASSIHFSKASNTQDSSTRPPSGLAMHPKPASSSIPVLRREKRRNQVASAAANLVQRKEVGDNQQGRKTSDVRWDPYSGEITTSSKGKPQSVKPGEYTPPGARSTDASLGNQSSVTGPAKSSLSFGERVRKLKPLNTPVEKPEWKGATGRATLVSPVTDQPDMAPLSIPRKSSKRVASPIISGSSTPLSAIQTTITETSPVSSQPVNPSIRAVPSQSVEPSPKGAALPSFHTSDPTAPAASSAIKLALDTSTASAPTHERKDSVGTIERNFREALRRTFNTDPSEPYVQPPSRFSVTTYATSAGDTGSPRASTDSSRPPMPTPPRTYANNQEPTPASPILNRKRPKIGDSSKSSRNSADPSSPVLISMTSSITTKRNANNSKSLPKSPAEVGSQDLISSLQAQLDDLTNRRNNIIKSIRQMTELMPTDSVVETAEVRRKRDEEKHKVEFLKEEEADIRRQEHDIGLKLHRAWKRKDNDSAYESTGLWVKRVTG